MRVEPQAWAAVEAELDMAHREGRTIRFWLRDDDAVDVTPALERLKAVCDAYAMPVLLAVIPQDARPELAAWVDRTPRFLPCQHGFAHANHAPAGSKACELGGGRSIEAIIGDLRKGRARLKALFGPRLSDCLVPPWNRIDPSVVPHLPSHGYDRLSVFGPPQNDETGIPKLNTDLDIIDWRNGRVGRPIDEVARKLGPLVAAARQNGRPIGLLTHHLVHDEAAWNGLGALLTCLRDHPATKFCAAADLAYAQTAAPDRGA